ncbi:hypothetical protein [Halostagnicola sp. A-GB9-2]|uniref:hypothetical protein n=1 Tax=Halostagnicola sp. A-GB9-2 TaxID=3048066 RepID=UPI0024C069DB|nr:hypothetical protein [Halostagnicola sp. A-GB9-2]MDJ1433967.1 hypothetical protein [Halostagnicola sp. A-GB9-2]
MTTQSTHAQERTDTEPHDHENVDPEQFVDVHQLRSGDVYFVDPDADAPTDKRWLSAEATVNAGDWR